jgi:hypothetical protein
MRETKATKESGNQSARFARVRGSLERVKNSKAKRSMPTIAGVWLAQEPQNTTLVFFTDFFGQQMRNDLIDELTASRLLSVFCKTAGVLVDCEKFPLHSDLDGLVDNY